MRRSTSIMSDGSGEADMPGLLEKPGGGKTKRALSSSFGSFKTFVLFTVDGKNPAPILMPQNVYI